MLDAIMPFIPVIAIVLVVLFILLLGYVKAPPDQAYIISGLKKESKVLIGRAGIRVPIFERLDKLYLGQMTVDIKTEQSVPTSDFINVNVDAVAKVRISPQAEGIKLAAKNFLNKRPEDITRDLQDSLQGNMREIIGTLSLKEINTDRDSFSDQVMQKASKDMDKLGIEILSCNIQNVTDENGLIKDLGADNTSLIKKNAAIAKAQADRDIAIAQAEAERESNEARVQADTQIAQKQTELEIKRAERKSIETATVNAEIAKTQRQAELKQVEVEVQKQKLEAEIRAQADAERYRQQQEAEAALFKRQKDAEAARYEQEQKAQAEMKIAEAQKYTKEQEAEGIAAVGKAEAEAIRAKALAEAEGIDKKAEAMKKYGEAAVIEMVMQALPEIAKNVAAPLSRVDKITMYGEGNSAKLLEDIVSGTAQVTEGISQSMGIDVKALVAGMLGRISTWSPFSVPNAVQLPLDRAARRLYSAWYSGLTPQPVKKFLVSVKRATLYSCSPSRERSRRQASSSRPSPHRAWAR